MQTDNILVRKISDLVKKDGRYRAQAYLFILGALDFTLKKTVGGGRKAESKRQVTGQELSHGIREYALLQFGPTAKIVFDHWGLKSTLDFGHIVYNLISIGLMGKSETDKLEDFKDVFNFEEEFVKKYSFKVDKRRL